MTSMSRKRSSFTSEFKDEMVKLYLEQQAKKTVSEVARENGVGTETLRNWVKAYQKAHPVEEEPLTISERARLRELEREVRELKLEKEFLGKAAAFFAKDYR
jgi:transposase